MGILVNCDSCDTEFNASSKAAGKRVKCPACGENVRVPMEDDEDDEPAPARRSSSNRSSGRASSNRKQNQGSNGLLLGLGIGGGGVAVLGLIFVMMSRGGAGNPPAQPATAQAVPPANAPAVASTTPVQPAVPPTAAAYPPHESHGIPITPEMRKSLIAQSNATVVADKVNSSGAVSEPAGSSAAKVEEAPLREMNMTELAPLIDKSLVRIIVRSEIGASVGSGFVIDTDGSIMTNYHVIEGAKSAVVEFETGKKVNVAGFTTFDQERDLAIIKIDVDSSLLTKVRIAKDLPQKGEKVAAFGAPRGLGFTASDGIISAIRHTPDFTVRKEGTYLQTTAPISPGNSGGPLVNMRGEVVGVNSFKIEGENLNFAASATDIREVIGNNGEKLVALSPEALPRREVAKGIRAENLAGTTRGNILLSKIHDVVIMMLPFSSDPTGSVVDYVQSQVKRQLLVKAKWNEITRQSQLKGSTAFVVVVMYFRIAENVKDAEDKGISELMCRVQIVARDVDKDGEAYAAIVWDESSPLGTIGLQSMMNGIVPEAMKKKVTDFFNKIVTSYRKAQRDVESGK